jgi:alkanesulfonate monooxygenase SsuD/methylene tetrahydromethanopterin reductase-like flavin-dependent oxidoreductase (luciferase family)
LELACRTATLDVLSGGRLLLGVGVGWNREELENHRPDVPFGKRYAAMRERVAALRAAWGQEEAAFEGAWDRFSPSWVNPKPIRGHVPIALGNSFPLGIRHAAQYADHWSPIDAHLVNEAGEPDVLGGIAWFRSLVEQFGRDPDSVPITLWMFRRPEPRRLERYAPLGLERLVLSGSSAALESEATTLRTLDELTPIVNSWKD